MSNFKAREYQQRAIDFIKKTPKCALWLPMGAGKTACSLVVIKHYIDNKIDEENKCSTLIVAPKTVMLTTWQNEIKKWENFNHLTCEVLHGKNKESTYINTNANIYIINYEGLAWLNEYISKTKRLKFNAIIFDESSKLKSWRTSRFKVCRILCKCVDRITLLSATPNPNSFFDLWSQYFMIDSGQRLGKTVSNFRSKYFYEEGYKFKKYFLREKAKETILQRISDITFRIDENELPKIPELSNNILKIKLTNKLQTKYDLFEKEMFFKLTDFEGVEPINAAALIVKCRQFVQGFLYYNLEDDTNKKQTIDIHNTKLEHLLDLIESFNGEPTLIAYSFREDYYRLNNVLAKKYKLAHIGFNSNDKQMKANESKWNNKELDILLCNPQSVSHGLNLQKGGSNIIWYGLTYNWEHYTQLIGRLHRQGQQKNVRNHVLIMRDTIDEAIYNALQQKEHAQSDFLNSLYVYKKGKQR